MAKSNPNDVLGSNEYAGFRAPSRADQSTIGGDAGSFYPGSQENGNVVDRGRIPKTLTEVSSSGTAAKPGGVPSGSGY